ncbi:MAG: MBL fold metallo-hydrolase [Treponema sp.]|nr:MBL fold metallo-hydrolase [Treponema sp.]
MDLNFLGRGAGFNPDEGSTSAYFVDNGEMFLIDCGESIFHSIWHKKIMDSVSALNVFITHTHSDHVGSLGSLMLYSFAAKKMPVNLIIDRNVGYLSSLKSLIKIFGLTKKMFNFADTSDFDGKYSLFSKVRYIKVTHSKELEACSLLFETDRGLVFYSGDLNDTAPVMELINSGRRIDKMYIDSNGLPEPNPHHLTVQQLNDIVPPDLKSRVYCMHINNAQCIDEAQACGFNVVTVD